MIKIIITSFLLFICFGLYATENSSLYSNAIRVFSSQAIHLTYTSIASLADRYDLGDFEDNEALKEIDVYIKFAKQSSDELEKLQKLEAIPGEEMTFVNNMIAGFYLLSAEANSFKSYINTQQQEHLDNFYKNQTEAWDKISKLLNIQIPDEE